MALWHWILGGAGAYLLYKNFGTTTPSTLEVAAQAWAAKIGVFYNVPVAQVIILPANAANTFNATVHGVVGTTTPITFSFPGSDAGLDAALAAAKAAMPV